MTVLKESLEKLGLSESEVSELTKVIEEKAEEKAAEKIVKIEESLQEKVLEDLESLAEAFIVENAELDDEIPEQKVIIDITKTIAEAIDEKYQDELAVKVNEISEKFEEQLEEYTAYLKQELQTLKESVGDELHIQLAKDLVESLLTTLGSYNIQLPADGIDVMEEVESELEEYRKMVNEALEESSKLRSELIEFKKKAIMEEVSEGLSTLQKESLKTLAESVDFTTEEMFKASLAKLVNTIKLNEAKVPSSSKSMLSEAVSEEDKDEFLERIKSVLK